jgi:hypothetical protein
MIEPILSGFLFGIVDIHEPGVLNVVFIQIERFGGRVPADRRPGFGFLSQPFEVTVRHVKESDPDQQSKHHKLQIGLANSPV